MSSRHHLYLLAVLSWLSYILVGAGDPAAIALSGNDLLAFRTCAEYCHEWRDTLSPNARKHLVDDVHTLVVLRGDNLWQCSSGALELTDVTGVDGDYTSVRNAIADMRFTYVRCLVLRDRQPSNAATTPCVMETILRFVNAEAPEADRKALRRLVGAAIAHLPDEARNRLFQHEESRAYAEVALAEYVNTEKKRQVMATQPLELPTADEDTYRVALNALWGRYDLLGPNVRISAAPFRESEFVLPFEASPNVTFYVAGRAGKDKFPNIVDLKTITDKVQAGEWTIAVAKGADDVVRFEIRPGLTEYLGALQREAERPQ